MEMNRWIINKLALCFGLFLLSSSVLVNAEEKSADKAKIDIWKSVYTIERGIPDAGDHPGNVYLVGEEVIAKASPGIPLEAVKWRALDDSGKVAAEGEFSLGGPGDSVNAGKLGLGWYRIEFLNNNNKRVGWTSTAVLAKLSAPVPQDSPICIDGANAWFAQENPEKQEELARLAALTGVNWIRDRIKWREMQPTPDEFSQNTTYDDSAKFQSQFGLKVLQVFHDTPEWAVAENSRRGRFAEDLRHVYRFCKEMSLHFKGTVQAWEPWNESNAHDFGGHTVDEMCSMQKAAYLGYKAGDPDMTVCWNAYAGVPTPLHTKGILENEAWSYFDAYSIHTYDWPSSYVALRAPAIEAACGRPLWVTESDRGINYHTYEPWCDISEKNELLKAQFMAQSYATSLFAGCTRHFHFILGHYFERRNKIQFGLLRLDLTPRPSYVAFAAVGRLLAGARCLGRWNIEEQPETHIYAFRAKPDGVERDVLVVWAEKKVDWAERGKTSADWPFPEGMPIQALYDYFGRQMKNEVPSKIESKATYVLLPKGEADKLPLQKPMSGEYRVGESSNVVLQLVMPESSTVAVTTIPWSVEHEHQIETDKELELSLYIYNFSDQAVSGKVNAEHIPEGWILEPSQWEMTLEPMEQKALPVKLKRPAPVDDASADIWIKLRGDFGNAGKPVLAFRLIAKPGEAYPKID